MQKEVLETELNRDDEDLIIKECNNSIEHRNAYQGRMLPPEMSMYYPAMMYYPGHPQAFPVYAGGGKSETFLPYSPAPSHSPGKNSSAYKNLNQFYPTPNYPAQNVYSPQQPYTQTNIFSARQEGSIPQQTEILENERFTGRLKFFDDGKNYGFIIMDADESDIFVHYDDLQKAGITK